MPYQQLADVSIQDTWQAAPIVDGCIILSNNNASPFEAFFYPSEGIVTVWFQKVDYADEFDAETIEQALSFLNSQYPI